MKIGETNRLVISEAKNADADFFYTLLNSSSWLKHIGDRGIKNKKDAVGYIEGSLMKSYLENGFGLYKVSIKETNTPIGVCGFLKRDYLDAPDIGFAVLPEYKGLGYMLEAASEMMQYGKNTLGFTKILAVTTESNERSKKLLRKLNLAPVGTVNANEKGVPFLLFSNQPQ
ncbi:GNAT family N-acetyltransferase [Maribacter sp. PR1]|uniref:GNAT family N-acetyltransferase n=1 Tax=Maribacter cobaltidurans TaxID=1178778 RepID=A0ABU7IYR4_9FLAO|nr:MULTISPECIES: GNAT family N-acetyltransferase [Maribacter]MDC6390732.1 GNAT family N-acetyltransferase [Maribacter sp. PR1]MEE1978124.1 GNAT family N-acetyltransferase [Maribacter cobaltidurans]